MSKHRSVSEAVLLPPLPRVLETASGAVIPIASVSDVGLRELGRLWTLALIARNRVRITEITKTQPRAGRKERK